MSSSSMAAAAPDVEMRVSRVLFTMRWRLMSQILLALPVVGMFICLITSIIFHSDHINNTICKVSAAPLLPPHCCHHHRLLGNGSLPTCHY